VHHLRCTAYY